MGNVIAGVEVKRLITHGDQRGFFREIIRVSDPFFGNGSFAQWSHSKMQRNVVKAWHFHLKQIDWWYVPIGLVEVVLYDNRQDSPTFKEKMVFYLGDDTEKSLQACVRIPQGVLHGCKVLSDEAHLFYITSREYDPNDEGRYPYNSEIVGHDWGTDVIVSEQDRREFIPKGD